MGQNSLFKSISTTNQYTGYRSVLDSDNDGVYEIRNRQFVVKFKLETLTTGEGYSISAIVDKGSNKGKESTIDVVEGSFTCKGYPYESVIRHKSNKEGIVAIGDYVFFLKGISDDGTSYTGIDEVYIKDGASVGDNAGKKKMSFKEKMKALKNASTGGATSANYGAEHKALESQNLRKLITDYLVAMKAKQDARTAKEKQSDKNISKAKDAIASKEQAKRDAEKAKRDAEWAEAKRYNDSIKATPEHQELERRKRQNEANYQASQNRTGGTQGKVTIHNKTGKDIYVYQDGSSNSTTIRANSSTKVNCSSNYTYKFDPNSGGSGSACYNANSGCGRSVTVN